MIVKHKKRMYKMRYFLILASVVLIASCVRNKKGQETQSTSVGENENVFEVSEVVQASSYTYMKVKENDSERWVAVGKQEVDEGDVFYYDEALQMTNFHSKDLDRTFEVIYFVNQISTSPVEEGGMGSMHGHDETEHSGKVETDQKSNISMEKDDNELTVARIFEDRDQFSGKETEIRGIVVKVNKGVMGKNWIHIQDGTDSNGNFDLTITSQDLAEVNDEVTFKGVITLDKDFGAGYFYDVIMEDAELISSETVRL